MMEDVLMEAAPPETGSSFTALLELPANQAMELLHQPESGDSPAVKDQLGSGYGSNCSDAFVSSTDLVQRTAMFSMISTPEDMSENSFIPSNSSENSLKLKKEEQTISDSLPISSPLNSEPAVSNGRRRATKRKEQEKKEVKASASKRSKSVESGKAREQSKDGEKLPFVHVRARRGQATDSHSLAERARREKINARMKLLQEIVPGCSKISGTALVLDEIINHVQSLQRQVEFLSMRLAAVNPRIDFNLESILAEENGVLTPSIYPITVTHEPSSWPEVLVNHVTEGQQYHNQNQPQDQHQLWNLSGLQQAVWERNNNQNVVASPENSVFSYSSTNSVPLPLNQLKMEI